MISSNKIRILKSVYSIWTILKSRLSAKACKNIHMRFLDFDFTNTVISFVSYINYSRVSASISNNSHLLIDGTKIFLDDRKEFYHCLIFDILLIGVFSYIEATIGV